MRDKIFIEDLEAECRIGIFDWERRIRQKIVLTLEFPADIKKAARRDRIEDALDYKKITKHTLAFVSKSEYFLIETLAEALAGSLLKNFKLLRVKIRLSKPGALRNARTVGVELVRARRR